MTKNIKILGICTVVAITGLSLENALTGHGIKGNKNLNPSVLATGSNSGSGTVSGTTMWESVISLNSEGEWGDWYFPDYVNHPTKMCHAKTSVYNISCILGGSVNCFPATLTETITQCIEKN